MLGEVAGHPDERSLLYTLFLNATPMVASRMLVPALFMLDCKTYVFSEVQPVDLALVSGETQSVGWMDRQYDGFSMHAAHGPQSESFGEVLTAVACQRGSGFAVALIQGLGTVPAGMPPCPLDCLC
jgi:hypothetical protein